MLLDRTLLDRFDASLEALGAPILGAWAPGLSDAEIDALLVPLGIDLPAEARVWWGWHNGTREDAPNLARSLGFRTPLSLKLAAECYAVDLEYQEEIFESKALLAPINEMPNVYFACNDADHGRVPIYTQNDVETPVKVLPSIRELVLTWLALIDNNV